MRRNESTGVDWCGLKLDGVRWDGVEVKPHSIGHTMLEPCCPLRGIFAPMDAYLLLLLLLLLARGLGLGLSWSVMRTFSKQFEFAAIVAAIVQSVIKVL